MLLRVRQRRTMTLVTFDAKVAGQGGRELRFTQRKLLSVKTEGLPLKSHQMNVLQGNVGTYVGTGINFLSTPG